MLSAARSRQAATLLSARVQLRTEAVRYEHNKRFHVDGSIGGYVSEQPRPVPRPQHFQPAQPQAPMPRAPLPMKRPKGLTKQVEPRLHPLNDTHTNMIQPDHYRMQFQLEPATRTRVKEEGINAKVHDYTSAEVFTRAPWPHYREILINRPRHLHALNPALMLQIDNMLTALELNKDITAGLLSPVHAGSNLQVAPGNRNRSAGTPGSFTGSDTRGYKKSFSTGMCYSTLRRLLRETEERKKRHANRVRDNKDYTPSNMEETIDALPGSPLIAKYFRSLYALAFRMSHVRLPLVTILDGIVSGAGAGVGLQGRYRVATENTRINFPQGAQGWFPDAGASYILSRLDGRMGLFLALTGWEVRGYDAVRLGLATHYCESDEVWRFGKRIGDSSLNFQFAEDTIEQAFGMFSAEGSPTHFPLPLAEFHRVIDDIFHVPSALHMFSVIHEKYEPELAAMESYHAELDAAKKAPLSFGKIAIPSKPKTKNSFEVLSFVREVVNRLLRVSPTSLKVIFKQMQLAQWLPLEKCIQLEYRLAQRLCTLMPSPSESDLFRAPYWHRASFAEVSDAEIETIFQENWDTEQEMKLEYPPKNKDTWYI